MNRNYELSLNTQEQRLFYCVIVNTLIVFWTMKLKILVYITYFSCAHDIIMSYKYLTSHEGKPAGTLYLQQSILLVRVKLSEHKKYCLSFSCHLIVPRQRLYAQ